jgi:predicted acylesterase/phospholipase RssA
LVEIWEKWHTRDVMRTDWAALLRGALLWAPNLMTNAPEHESAIDPYVRDDRLRAGATFRFNLANLTTGEDVVLSYPGSEMPLPLAVGASVAVPVAFTPVEWRGAQLSDGLTIDGCPLEQTVLGAGVERVFVIGVAPRSPLPPCRNALDAANRAGDWNQYAELLHAIDEAEETNRSIRRWREERAAALRAVEEHVAEPALRAELRAELERAYATDFPYSRDPVEIVAILPREDLRVSIMRFEPENTRRLLALGRADARAALQALAPTPTPTSIETSHQGKHLV